MLGDEGDKKLEFHPHIPLISFSPLRLLLLEPKLMW